MGMDVLFWLNCAFHPDIIVLVVPSIRILYCDLTCFVGQ